MNPRTLLGIKLTKLVMDLVKKEFQELVKQ